jgi:hypothetical protein
MELLNPVQLLREIVRPQEGEDERQQLLYHLLQIRVDARKHFDNMREGTDHPKP